MGIEHGGASQMNCGQLAEALIMAADDELSADQLLVMQTHLAACEACRAHQAVFSQADRRLRDCGGALDALSPSSPHARVQIMGKLTAPDHDGWTTWPGWKWNAGALAALSFTVLAVWIIGVSRSADHTVESDGPAGGTQVIRIELPFAPVGDPFLDGSPQSESSVPADVVIGSDGQPGAVNLAN